MPLTDSTKFPTRLRCRVGMVLWGKERGTSSKDVRKIAKLVPNRVTEIRRKKATRIVARVYEQVSNVRQDYLHKLSRKIVDNNQVVVVENLNIKGMVRNHKLAKVISDTGWGTFTNFLAYKLEKEGKVLVEINRWFPSSKLCSNCHYQISELPLDVRTWICPSCGTQHDRDGNAATNIRAEGIRMLSSSGTGEVNANGEEVRPIRGRKSVMRHSFMKLEAPPSYRVG